MRPANASRPCRYLVLAGLMASTCLQAQDELADLTARGQELFFERVSCWICHGENADGLIGPTLLHGPTPITPTD